MDFYTVQLICMSLFISEYKNVCNIYKTMYIFTFDDNYNILPPKADEGPKLPAWPPNADDGPRLPAIPAFTEDGPRVPAIPAFTEDGPRPPAVPAFTEDGPRLPAAPAPNEPGCPLYCDWGAAKPPCGLPAWLPNWLPGWPPNGACVPPMPGCTPKGVCALGPPGWLPNEPSAPGCPPYCDCVPPANGDGAFDWLPNPGWPPYGDGELPIGLPSSAVPAVGDIPGCNGWPGLGYLYPSCDYQIREIKIIQSVHI